jgi:hypothetical protein
LVVEEIVEVLYSPVKAFKKVIEKPDFKGVLIILSLVIGATVALQFVYNSKQYYEIRAPTNDDWTESANTHLWTSHSSISLDITDYQMGNSSILSSAQDSSTNWLKLTDIESVNCSGARGYTELFFWINWTNQKAASPTHATIKLYSGIENSYFERDITNMLGSNSEWKNITLNVGPEQGWASSNAPDWQNITGIEIQIDWINQANLELNIDGIYFNVFLSPLESVGVTEAALFILTSVTFSVGINWVLWAGIMYISARLFGEDMSPWNSFFIIIGYTFIATAVYTLISALIFTSLPVLYMPVEAERQLIAFGETWLPNIGYQVGTIILWAGEVWIAALSAIVIRLLKNVPWGKAATIAGVAFLIRFVLRFFFGF